MLRFRLLGNWDNANMFVNKLPKTVLKASLDSQKDLATRLKAIVVSHIKNNDLDVESLAISTIRRKGHNTPFFEHGDYIRSISIWKEGNIYYCGIKKNARNSKGEGLYLIANTLEYGAETSKGSIPERPLWRPSIKELGGRNGIRNKVEKLIKSRLRIMNSRFTFTIR